MTSGKGVSEDSGQPHLIALLGELFEHFRHALQEGSRGGLRLSHLRVLGNVPATGITITELSRRLGMTKQGCGQLVTRLVSDGLLAAGADPSDRRSRVVTTTKAGRAAYARFRRLMDATEEEWAERVGRRRYATFRTVLRELGDSPG